MEASGRAAAAGSGILFGGRRWTAAIEAAYGFTSETVLLPGGKPVPYLTVSGAGGDHCIAYPFCDYLPLRSAEEVRGVLEGMAAAHPRAKLTVKSLCRSDEVAFGQHAAGVSREAVLHVIDTSQRKPSARFRANARRAVRDGVSARETSHPAALRRFYDLYAALRVTKFERIPQPLAFFQAIYDQFVAEGRGYFLEAVYEEAVIASFYILEVGTTAYYKFSASSLSQLVPRPNNLLFAHLRQQLDEGRYSAIDLGLSGLGENYAGLRYFKSTTGASQYPIRYFTYVPPEYSEERRTRELSRLRAITNAVVQLGLTPDQLSLLSEAIYPEFA